MENNKGQPGMVNNNQFSPNYYVNVVYNPARVLSQVGHDHHQFYYRNTDISHQYRSMNNNVNFNSQQQYYPPQQLPHGHINGRPMNDNEYFNSMPPGLRFCPTDAELIVFYLLRKLTNRPLPRNYFHDVELYKSHPQHLAGNYKLCSRETSWYFFTPTEKRFNNGSRPSRLAGDGYWRPTGTDKVICFGNSLVGYKKSLDYYEGPPGRGKKTDWKMHEYRTIDQDKKAAASDNNKRDRENNKKLNDWVLCRLYKKFDKKNKNNDEDAEDPRAAAGSLSPFQNHSSQQEYSNQLDISDYPLENDFGWSTSTNINVLDNYEQHHVAGQLETSMASNHGSLAVYESGINPQVFDI